MTVKLDHYWTINPLKYNEYSKFMIKKFIPGVNRLNLHTVAAWSVLVGAYSEIVLETVSNDLDIIEKAMVSKEYRDLKYDLLNYITNYKTKVLVSTGKKDTYSTDIREETIKFTQTWDIISEKREDYDRYSRYVVDEFYPLLENLGVFVAGEWEVLIGDGPRIICEGRVTELEQLIGNLQSERFRKAKKKLKDFVTDYQSRILSFHIRKVKGYKSASYDIVTA